ncbi:hypothetical protein LINPERPRIM_LOCUS36433 [Linum perenne]
MKSVISRDQVERLMIIGHWCCHYDEIYRLSIRQVISVLKMEATLPSLPTKLSVLMRRRWTSLSLGVLFDHISILLFFVSTSLNTLANSAI